jgi:hypothetical protein
MLGYSVHLFRLGDVDVRPKLLLLLALGAVCLALPAGEGLAAFADDADGPVDHILVVAFSSKIAELQLRLSDPDDGGFGIFPVAMSSQDLSRPPPGVSL